MSSIASTPTPNTLSPFLSQIKYNKICKYWSIIENITYKLDNFNFKRYETDYKEEDDKEYIKGNAHNKKIDSYHEKLVCKLKYYKQEYEKYINKIGFELNDQTYDEYLFNLLNNGIVLN